VEPSPDIIERLMVEAAANGVAMADDAIEMCARLVEAMDRAEKPPASYAALAAEIRRLKSDLDHKMP